MVNSILKIGHCKYRLDKTLLKRCMRKAGQDFAVGADAQDVAAVTYPGVTPDALFNEVMELYNEYARSESLDVLVRLKCKLEQACVMYGSHELAEEVLSINSCLPYERRVPAGAGISCAVETKKTL